MSNEEMLLQAMRALSGAYVALLRLSPVQRIGIQSELCACRDAIADVSDISPETVQNTHETLAMLKGSL